MTGGASANLLTPPGEIGVKHGAFDYEQCVRIARRAGPAALLRSDDRDILHPFRYGSFNYAGQYTQRDDSYPRYLKPLTEELDEEFPEECTETSLLRIRSYRGGYTHGGGHIDGVSDYRHIVIVRGSGQFCYRPRLSTSSELVKPPISVGDRITLNNTEPKLRFFHHVVAEHELLMVVYGKILAPTEDLSGKFQQAPALQ